MAFLSANPTPIAPYLGEVQDVAYSTAASGSPNVDSDKKEEAQAEPTPAPAPVKATNTATEHAAQPQQAQQTTSRSQTTSRPQTTTQTVQTGISETGKATIAEHEHAQQTTSRPQTTTQTTSQSLAPTHTQRATFEAWKKDTTSTPRTAPNASNKTQLKDFSINTQQTTKNATEAPKTSAQTQTTKSAPNYVPVPKGSIFDGSATSAANLHNATAFLSSLFGGSGKGIGVEKASKVVDATKTLGKVEGNVLSFAGKTALYSALASGTNKTPSKPQTPKSISTTSSQTVDDLIRQRKENAPVEALFKTAKTERQAMIEEAEKIRWEKMKQLARY